MAGWFRERPQGLQSVLTRGPEQTGQRRLSVCANRRTHIQRDQSLGRSQQEKFTIPCPISIPGQSVKALTKELAEPQGRGTTQHGSKYTW